MPSVGHIAVGLFGARLTKPPGRLSPALWAALLVGLSLAPDLDVLSFRLGIPYGASFGHRGATHSIAFAGLSVLALGVVAWRFRIPPIPIIVVGGMVMVSHGVLDAFTDGGLGIALIWPFSYDRYFAPWRPILVAPLGWRLLLPQGMGLMLHECLIFLPLFLVGLWPRGALARER
jgi:inner membrane protein